MRQLGKSTSSSSGTMNAALVGDLRPSSQTAGSDRYYPAPGQQLPPTPLQPTQQAEAFEAQLELLYREQAARLRRFPPATTAPTSAYLRHLRPKELHYTGRPAAENQSQRSVARSQRTSTTVSDARHLHRSYMAPPPTYVDPSAAQPFAAPLSIAPSVRTQRTGRSGASKASRSVMVSGEVFAVVHQVTDALLQVTHQTRDDAVARKRLLLQQQQILQRDFIERDAKEREMQLERDKLAAEAVGRERELQLERERIAAGAIEKDRQLQFERDQKAAEAIETAKQMQLERDKIAAEAVEK